MKTVADIEIHGIESADLGRTFREIQEKYNVSLNVKSISPEVEELVNRKQLLDALEAERKYLANREQLGAADVLLKHTINIIDNLPTVKQPEVICCKDCQFHDKGENESDAWNRCRLHSISVDDNEYCSWAVRKRSKEQK